MKEKTLLKIALIVSLVGLAVLYFASNNLSLDESRIEKITLENKDDFVKVKGVVSKVIDSDKAAIIDIMQPNTIKVVLFKADNKPTTIKEGQEVEIIGKVDEYDGELEIIAHRARIVR
jgi:DNA/RNA endonuclease YhcR with UshA esterase domain